MSFGVKSATHTQRIKPNGNLEASQTLVPMSSSRPPPDVDRSSHASSDSLAIAGLPSLDDMELDGVELRSKTSPTSANKRQTIQNQPSPSRIARSPTRFPIPSRCSNPTRNGSPCRRCAGCIRMFLANSKNRTSNLVSKCNSILLNLYHRALETASNTKETIHPHVIALRARYDSAPRPTQLAVCTGLTLASLLIARYSFPPLLRGFNRLTRGTLYYLSFGYLCADPRHAPNCCRAPNSRPSRFLFRGKNPDCAACSRNATKTSSTTVSTFTTTAQDGYGTVISSLRDSQVYQLAGSAIDVLVNAGSDALTAMSSVASTCYEYCLHVVTTDDNVQATRDAVSKTVSVTNSALIDTWNYVKSDVAAKSTGVASAAADGAQSAVNAMGSLAIRAANVAANTTINAASQLNDALFDFIRGNGNGKGPNA